MSNEQSTHFDIKWPFLGHCTYFKFFEPPKHSVILVFAVLLSVLSSAGLTCFFSFSATSFPSPGGSQQRVFPLLTLQRIFRVTPSRAARPLVSWLSANPAGGYTASQLRPAYCPLTLFPLPVSVAQFFCLRHLHGPVSCYISNKPYFLWWYSFVVIKW